MWSCVRASKRTRRVSRTSAGRDWRASSGRKRSSLSKRCRRMRSAKSCARSCMRKTRSKPDARRSADAASRAKLSAPTNGTGATDLGAIEIDLNGGALVATLKRPRTQNRISHAMARELMDLAETVEDDDAILALAITGAGNVFCAGFDDDVDSLLVETLALLSKPTVAIINGHATDEGLELAMALDLRAAVIGARFALTQLERGRLPRFGGTQRLPRLIGGAAALQMILTCETIGGDDAMRLGLVTYLARDGKELERVVRELLAAP